MLITGKGANKAAFEREVSRLESGWTHVRVRTAWLTNEDYPRLLGPSSLPPFAVLTRLRRIRRSGNLVAR